MKKRFLPVAAMEKLIKEAGASRVSEDAKTALKDALEDIALDLAAEAWKYAQHAGRKTVKARDVKLVTK